MKSLLKVMTGAMATVLLATGCAVPAVKAPAEDEEPKEIPFKYEDVAGTELTNEDYLISEYNRYAFELMSNVASGAGAENVMVSPTSVMMAMDVVAAGANGSTLEQLTDLFAEGEDPLVQQAFAANLMDRINNSQDVEFACANAIWNNTLVLGDRMNSSYIDYVSEVFRAEAREEAFDDETKDRINEWISDNTDGMIEDMIKSLPTSTAMVVANAIAFDAEWDAAFNESYPGVFTDYSGESIEVTMLEDRMQSYYETEDAIGFAKLYEGGEYAFVAILPKDTEISANEFLAGFTGSDFEEFMNSETEEQVTVRMPEFEYDYSLQLKPVLIDMGAEVPFDPDEADFSRIADPSDLYIDQVIHNTHISVTEEGTRAAAATAIVLTDGACMIEQTKEINCDRPFAYVIIETSTNMPVFVGTVNNLSE